MTVQELRNLGYKVRVLHIRERIFKRRMDTSQYGSESAKGGITHVIIDSPNGDHYEGVARCNKKDNYNKKLGVKIAIGRSGVCQTK